MYKLFSVLLLCAVSSGAVAKGPCADEVCEKFYNAAITSHLSAEMQAIIVADEARQKGGQQEAISHYVSGMRAMMVEVKGRVQPQYQAALRSAKGNKDVTAALKDLYTKWLAGVSYFQNAALEAQGAKDVQYKKDKKSIEDAWVKVQTEAGI